MENSNKKYFTLEGLDALYENYTEAIQEANRKGYKNKYPLGFESKEEAELLRTGHWNENFLKEFKPFDTEAEAIIYADGSFDSKKQYATYGLIIFFKSGEVYCESAKLQDDDHLKKYIIHRFDQDSNELQFEYGEENRNNDIIKSARQYAGECAGVMRGLDICCNMRKLKRIVVVYDCESTQQGYDNARSENLRVTDQKRTGEMAKLYNEFCKKLYKKECPEVEFLKVDSHTGEYRIGTEEFANAIYNDVVDILAKAETTEIKLKREENFNLVRAMSGCEFQTFGDVNAKRIEERRAHARSILVAVLHRMTPNMH